MAFIPNGAKWYLAKLVEEITVESEASSIVHKNLVLIRADSPEQAYAKAKELGTQAQVDYKNPKGKKVKITFKGLNELSVIYEELEHGAELAYEELIGLTEDEVQAMIRAKQELSVFRAVIPSRGPDYSSADVLSEASKMLSKT